MRENLVSLIRKSLPNKDDQQLALEILEEEGLDVSGDTVARIVLLLVKFMRGLEKNGEIIGKGIAAEARNYLIEPIKEIAKELGRTLQTVSVSELTRQYKGFKEAAEEIRHANYWRTARHIGLIVGVSLAVSIVTCFGVWLWTANLRDEHKELAEKIEVERETLDELRELSELKKANKTQRSALKQINDQISSRQVVLQRVNVFDEAGVDLQRSESGRYYLIAPRGARLERSFSNNLSL